VECSPLVEADSNGNISYLKCTSSCRLVWERAGEPAALGRASLAGHPELALPRLVGRAGDRWSSKAGFERGKQE